MGERCKLTEGEREAHAQGEDDVDDGWWFVAVARQRRGTGCGAHAVRK